MQPHYTPHARLPRIMGVYALTQVSTGHQYVGASVHVHARWQEHLRDLKQGRHWNDRLQMAWDADGASGLSLSILEVVTDRAMLWKREAHWLRERQPVFNAHLRGRPDALAAHLRQRPPQRHRGGDLSLYLWPRMNRTGGADACWLWLGKCNRDGYGTYRFDRRVQYAHRSAWILTHGLIPAGQHVLHGCDTQYAPGDITYRRCCNPAHLFLGTQAENIADMMAKGRSRKAHGNDHWTRQPGAAVLRGETRSNAKLASEQVLLIRRRYAAGGVSMPALARDYGVTYHLIWGIIRRAIWTHLPAEPDGLPPRSNHRTLTADEVRAIRLLYHQGQAVGDLAAQFGLHRQTVYRIVHRKTWRHVAD